MSDINYVSLSKAMSKALRHRPERIGIELADDGSVELETLVDALNRRGGWPRELDMRDIINVVKYGSKNRFALENGRIRARYGHSIPLRTERQPATPPDVLYHGTSQSNLPSILEEGLLPMGRRVVHLSVDVATAREVGSRRGGRVAILRVDARDASAGGISFYEGNESTWLAERIPVSYLAVMGDDK